MMKFLPTLIVMTLCMQYLLLAINANELVKELVGNNNVLRLFELSNNITFFLFPVIILSFIVGTTKYMLEIFDENKISLTEIFSIVGYALVFPLIGMSFYTICFFLRDYQVTSVDDIENLHFIFGLTIRDFNLGNRLFWLLSYLMIYYQLWYNKKIIWWKVALSLIAPLLLMRFVIFIIT